MSLERYFRRAHDEARLLLQDAPWLEDARRRPDGRPRWLVSLRFASARAPMKVDRYGLVADAAVYAARADYSSSRPVVLYAARLLPFGLQRILDRAMVDTDGSPTLAAGEGAEARRLLGMVAWDRVPQARWPDVFDTLRMAAAWRSAGCASWLSALRSLLAEDGHLVDEAERSAA